MRFTNVLFSGVFAVFAGAPLAAEVPVGLWETGPDRSGLVFHVRTKFCGGALCGKIERAKDRRGYDTPSTAIGRALLSDMRLSDDGSFQGALWEHTGNRMLRATLRVSGNKLELENCDAERCNEVVWKRLR